MIDVHIILLIRLKTLTHRSKQVFFGNIFSLLYNLIPINNIFLLEVILEDPIHKKALSDSRRIEEDLLISE